MNKTLLTAALAGAALAGFACTAQADEAMSPQTKCYGIAKAGQNSCANAFGTHACKGMSKVDNDGGDFTMTSTVECTKAGGTTIPRKM